MTDKLGATQTQTRSSLPGLALLQYHTQGPLGGGLGGSEWKRNSCNADLRHMQLGPIKTVEKEPSGIFNLTLTLFSGFRAGGLGFEYSLYL